MRGDVHGFLAGGGVEHEKNFLRLDEVAQPDEFLHERFVNLQTSGGVEDDDVARVCLCEIQSFARDFLDICFAAFEEDWNFNLFAECFELIHGGRAINVGSNEQRSASLLLKKPREFAA